MKLVDITIPIRTAMTVYRGNPPVRIRPAMTLRKNHVNLSELCLGSHTGTHVDAPIHFIKGAKGIDRVDLERFIGPAWVALEVRIVSVPPPGIASRALTARLMMTCSS